MLCSTCRRIDFAGLLDEDGLTQDILHLPSYSALELSASSCSLCKLFYEGLYHATERLDPLAKISKHFPICVRGLRLGDSKAGMDGLTHIRVRWDNRHRSRWCIFSLYTDEADLQSVMVPSRLIPGKSIKSPDMRVPMMNEWLAVCGALHDSCKQGASPLPTRAIHISHNADTGRLSVRLEMANGRVGSYIALSHLWANSMPEKTTICTTRANLSSRMEQIVISSLPKVFQDAIHLTDKLGIQWLWIDALCIVQDDTEDYEKERLVMGNIYRCSYLTIAASGAQNPSQGLFLDRNKETHIPVKFTFHDDSTGGLLEGRVYIRPYVAEYDDLLSSNMHSRAWTLQEHLCSRRIIYFDIDQVIWICQEEHSSENQIIRHASDTDWKPLDSPFRRLIRFPEQWRCIVENYSRREMTRSSDRLRALASIAKVMEEKYGNCYLAGLWKEYLIQGLNWRRGSSNWMLMPTSGYRAPSWSWASLDGEVSYWGNSNYWVSWEATVVETSISALADNPRGEISSGFLKITGFVQNLDDKEAGFFMKESRLLRAPYLLQRRGESLPVGVLWFDQDPKCEHREGDIHCLLTRVYENGLQEQWYGLLLRPAGMDDNVFQRIGIACAEHTSISIWPSKNDVFSGSSERTIIII